jgi:hypothetical protein
MWRRDMSTFITALWKHDKCALIEQAQPPAWPSRSQEHPEQACRAEAYWLQAAECQQMANRWPHDLVRQQYEELARQWRALAAHAERQR